MGWTRLPALCVCRVQPMATVVGNQSIQGVAMSGTKAEAAGGVVAVEPCDVAAGLESVLFGAGCFWGVEAAFRKMDGVTDTAVGYSGGSVAQPTYEQVCTDSTGHAEVVRVVFDPKVVSFETLVSEFFLLHDPTQLNRQGPDKGSQYRSAIFCCSDAQRRTAERLRDELNGSGKLSRPVVTIVDDADTFWRGEEYHQRYLEKNRSAFCAI